MKHKANAGIICACLFLFIAGCGAGTESGTGRESLPESALADDPAQRASTGETSRDDLEEDAEELSEESADERDANEGPTAEPAAPVILITHILRSTERNFT